MAGRICAAVAEAAPSQFVLLELLGEFDAMDAIRYWTGFKSLAQVFDVHACVQALFTIKLPDQSQQD